MWHIPFGPLRFHNLLEGFTECQEALYHSCLPIIRSLTWEQLNRGDTQGRCGAPSLWQVISPLQNSSCHRYGQFPKFLVIIDIGNVVTSKILCFFLGLKLTSRLLMNIPTFQRLSSISKLALALNVTRIQSPAPRTERFQEIQELCTRNHV